MAVPKLITSNGMDVKKGWFDMSSLDYTAKINSSVTTEVKAGAVVHLDSAGTFSLGASDTAPAIFLIQGSTDADVINEGYNLNDVNGNQVIDRATFVNIAVAPTGRISGLVATGGYEIASTQFDSSKTYASGELLTAGNDGLLTNVAAAYTNPIVGVVSSGLGGMSSFGGDATLNHHGLSALSFWTCWLPTDQRTP
jgi:hypothetical protein